VLGLSQRQKLNSENSLSVKDGKQTHRTSIRRWPGRGQEKPKQTQNPTPNPSPNPKLTLRQEWKTNSQERNSESVGERSRRKSNRHHEYYCEKIEIALTREKECDNSELSKNPAIYQSCASRFLLMMSGTSFILRIKECRSLLVNKDAFCVYNANQNEKKYRLKVVKKCSNTV
jgi:hypothetical protein